MLACSKIFFVTIYLCGWNAADLSLYDARQWRHEQEKCEFPFVYLKPSKQMENDVFAKLYWEDINRILCHFFWCDYASCKNYARSCQLANQLLPLLERGALKRFSRVRSLSFSRLSPSPSHPFLISRAFTCDLLRARDIKPLEKRPTTGSVGTMLPVWKNRVTLGKHARDTKVSGNKFPCLARAQFGENARLQKKKLFCSLTFDEATYIHINTRCVKVKHTRVEIKLSIQWEFYVLCLAKTMLFT